MKLDKELYTDGLSVSKVHVTDRFWGNRMELVRTKVLPYEWDALNDRIPDASTSHAVANFKLAKELTEKGEEAKAKLKDGFKGFVFQDSDIAKWLEAIAYVLSWHEDKELEQTADEVIDLVCAAQQEDGYLDTYYIINGLDKKWTNLKDNHELYCLGHMLEAAVAYYEATHKDKLLNAMRRYVDYVDSVFGPEPEKKKGYPGHEELELALVKLYRITKEEKYIRLASYFIRERGKKPNYFSIEAGKELSDEELSYHQAHMPVTEQKEADGHAVRAVYLYTAMADLARSLNDEELFEACEILWKNMTEKQMYITGSIGATPEGEAFTFDYDLPNHSIYGETCAAIGLAFFAKRMLETVPKGEYGDVLEKVLYNGIISGISLDGTKFFYVNPLEVYPKANRRDERLRHVKITRQKWFGCACCPPNIARITAAVGSYFCSANEKAFYTHIPAAAVATATLGGEEVTIETKSEYPWNGTVEINFSTERAAEFTYGIRIPGWCENWSLSFNGQLIKPEVVNGYATVKKTWYNGDTLKLNLEMNAVVVEANNSVRQDIGKLAVMRGPVVYCLEEPDNGDELHLVSIAPDTAFEVKNEERLGGIVSLYCTGYKELKTDDTRLYRPVSVKKYDEKQLCFIPYYAWANREEGEMMVWVHKAR